MRRIYLREQSIRPSSLWGQTQQCLLVNPNKPFILQPFRYGEKHLNQEPQNRAASDHVVQHRVST